MAEKKEVTSTDGEKKEKTNDTVTTTTNENGKKKRKGHCCSLCDYDNKIHRYELENEGDSGFADVSFACLIICYLFNICDRRDQKILDRLRTERKEKIDELKEKTNYYITQQLIQKYDTDPTAKAAAATVLASKLGADSGLKVYMEDKSKSGARTGKPNNVEPVQASGLRNRKQGQSQSSSLGTTPNHPDQQLVASGGADQNQTRVQKQLVVVEHHQPQSSTKYDGGLVARIAALLVGEDPMQSYALICGNCYMHNGLARREEFPFITYYCPHCHALNKPKQSAEPISGFNLPNTGSPKTDGEAVKNASISASDSLVGNIKPIDATPEIKRISEEATPEVKHISEEAIPEVEHKSEEATTEIKRISEEATPEVKHISEEATPEVKHISEEAIPEVEHISEGASLGKEES
ncbi:hypothetical protein TSUD_09160 [Trifolium subterraneum]|nr:hypothetical protein TSUD_09160 [Trifolium subterraneum]